MIQSDGDSFRAIMELTEKKGVEVAIDCSGSSVGRHKCLEAARMWGNVISGRTGVLHLGQSTLWC